MRHSERHRTAHIGWLRAAVLGANDGLISTASLMVGVAAAGTGRADILVAGLAGLVAGSMSMAAGEYVSVSSQADTEQADLARERHELASAPDAEKAELVGIYEARGLTPDLARQVADQLMAKDALTAHARDELGLSEVTAARPLQAALASAGSFAVGAALPVGVAAVAPAARLAGLVTASALALLTVLGAVAARVGGRPWGAARSGWRSGGRWPWPCPPVWGGCSGRRCREGASELGDAVAWLPPSGSWIASWMGGRDGSGCDTPTTSWLATIYRSIEPSSAQAGSASMAAITSRR
jgi:VIT1/CCC1 family predicted Fe2+/Mn2+ transporter